jgi:hypothetical protein
MLIYKLNALLKQILYKLFQKYSVGKFNLISLYICI